MPAIDADAVRGLVVGEVLKRYSRGSGSSYDEDYYNGMVPNVGFNIAMLAIWGVILALHVLMVYLKQYWFSMCFICTGILEVLGYIGRTWSHFNVDGMTPFLMNMICLTISPVFTMAGLYYQLSKLIEIYGHKFSFVRPSILYAYVFTCCDIISLAIQASGGGVAGGESSVHESVWTGTQVFVAGLAFQVATLSVFMMLMSHFLFKVYVQTRWQYLGKISFSPAIFKISQREIDHFYRPEFHALRMEPDRKMFHYFIHALIIAIITVFVRCCYRLAEMVNGWSGYLSVHENYFIILDGVMMSVCAVSMTIFHPGFAFQGRTVSVRITNGGKHHKNKNNDPTPDIPQPESEQEDSATVSEDEKIENKEEPGSKEVKRNFSMPSLSGSTFVSRMASFKRPFGKSQRRSQQQSEIEQSSGEIPYHNDLYQLPSGREYPEIPEPTDSITPQVV
ncbi:related to Sphingoid long-chain base transporter RSB1 [Zygosaccharomyces bailii]|nr:related to Sphingoid long-chain base transporter RSB1 [Zygosaccharomyces bailii]